MISIPRHTVIAILLLAAAGLSWWLVRSADVPLPGAQAPLAQRHVPDYAMDDFTVSAMDDHGRLHYRLHARHMSHFLDDDTASLTRPDLTLYRQDKGSWNAVARRGWIGPDQKHVTMSGDVLVWRDAAKSDGAMEIETDELHITPDSQYAETGLPVTITQPAGVTHAVGMRVNVVQSRMELLSEVRGRYLLKAN